MATGFCGLYTLTNDGELGVVNADGRFVADRRLSHALGTQVRQLLRTYLADPARNGCRLGVIYRSRHGQLRKPDQCLLQAHVLREIRQGADSNSSDGETGVEDQMRRLVAYRHPRLPGVPVYCPLLYHRGTPLEPYFSLPGRAGIESIPIAEVLNLLAVVSYGGRNAPALKALMEGMQRSLATSGRAGAVESPEEREPAAPNVAAVSPPPAARSDDGATRAPRPHVAPPPSDIAAEMPTQQPNRFEPVTSWQPHRGPVAPERLRGFAPFRDLVPGALAALAAHAAAYTVPAGVRLADVGSTDPWNFYLLEGTLALQARDGASVVVTGGSPKAASPVAFLKPRKYTVTSRTPVSFLRIHDTLLRALLPAAAPGAMAARRSD